MKAKLLKRIRKKYYIAITERKFIKGNDTYVDSWFYEYSFASKKGTRAEVWNSFEYFITGIVGWTESNRLFIERRNSRAQREQGRRRLAIHENTLNKISALTK